MQRGSSQFKMQLICSCQKKEPEKKSGLPDLCGRLSGKNFSSLHPNLTPFWICIILLYACQAWLWEKKDDRSWSKVLAEIAVTIHTKKIIHIVIYFYKSGKVLCTTLICYYMTCIGKSINQLDKKLHSCGKSYENTHLNMMSVEKISLRKNLHSLSWKNQW